jgi:trehalose/maltose hydrolase-like predicted phosphorylase
MSSPGSLRRRFAALIVAVPLTGFAAASATAASGDHVFTARSAGSGYSPTFTGNGELGVRVPPAGQGYAGGTVPAQSELAGFYAKPSRGKPSDLVQQRANIPTWSTLTFTDGNAAFAPKTGHTTGWRQTLDVHTGVITTSADWTAPDGHVSDVRYDVFTDRARLPVGVVRLTVTPLWSGSASVADLIDGSPATLTTQVGKGWDDPTELDWVEVATKGTNIKAALASRLATSPNVSGTAAHVAQSGLQSVGREVTFPVTAGQTYVLTKYVAVEDTQTASDPVSSTRSDAADAATRGYAALRSENDAAWARLWTGAIDVLGNRQLASEVNASEFYLWSSTTAGVNWSVSPAGLSSNGYDGHVFWDAET